MDAANLIAELNGKFKSESISFGTWKDSSPADGIYFQSILQGRGISLRRTCPLLCPERGKGPDHGVGTQRIRAAESDSRRSARLLAVVRTGGKTDARRCAHSILEHDGCQERERRLRYGRIRPFHLRTASSRRRF